MDLFLAICQGLGLALAVGIGGMLPVLFASVLAHVDIGWDLDGTDFDWFATEWFIPILFVLNIGEYFLARSSIPKEQKHGMRVMALAVFGAIVFAASMAEETSTWWPGIVLGGVTAAFAVDLTVAVLGGATARSEDTAGTLQLLVVGAALLLVLIALFLPPASIVAAIGLVVLALGRRRRAAEKYEGLRSLR